MGLYVDSESAGELWSGAYSAFNRWRNKVAEAAGYLLQDVVDSSGSKMETAMIDWGHLTEENLYGTWEETPADPLLVLIAHADCEGSIYPAQAAPLADRLTELLPLLPDGEGGGHIGSWRETTQKFITGLRVAAEAGETVEFM